MMMYSSSWCGSCLSPKAHQIRLPWEPFADVNMKKMITSNMNSARRSTGYNGGKDEENSTTRSGSSDSSGGSPFMNGMSVLTKGSGTTARGRRLLKIQEEKRKREYDRLHNYPAWAKSCPQLLCFMKSTSYCPLYTNFDFSSIIICIQSPRRCLQKWYRAASRSWW